jgi:hypothetical protein
MALALFRKSSPPSQPARAALVAHLREVSELQARRAALSERDAMARRDREQGETSAARVSALSQACDQSRADARYGAGGADLPALEAQLREAEAAHSEVAGFARSASIAHSTYSREIASLSAQAKELSERTAKLLYDALLEEQLQRRTAFDAARVAMIEAFHNVLVPGFAIDDLAKANHWPVIGGSQQFADLNIPLVPAFDPQFDHTDMDATMAHGKRLAAEHQSFNDTWQQTRERGAQLANAMLSTEG